jgi:dUTP pyrophosphatase
MFNKVKEINKLMSDLKNLQKEDMSEEKMFETLGFDKSEFEKKLTDAMRHKVELKFTKISDDAVSPKYNYESDSGFDLHATEEIIVPPLGRALVSTGLKFDIPIGYEMQVRPKSGLALKEGLTVLNTPGTVDQGYDGEVKVIVFNTNQNHYQIIKGQKIAQAVLCPVLAGRMISVTNVVELNAKERGDNGFGSTGI